MDIINKYCKTKNIKYLTKLPKHIKDIFIYYAILALFRLNTAHINEIIYTLSDFREDLYGYFLQDDTDYNIVWYANKSTKIGKLTSNNIDTGFAKFYPYQVLMIKSGIKDGKLYVQSMKNRSRTSSKLSSNPKLRGLAYKSLCIILYYVYRTYGNIKVDIFPALSSKKLTDYYISMGFDFESETDKLLYDDELYNVHLTSNILKLLEKCNDNISVIKGYDLGNNIHIYNLGIVI